MTEYDYSPEAYEAHLATQAKISRWVDKTNRLYPHLGNPFTPATPAVHDSDLPPDLQEYTRRSSKKSRDRDRDRLMMGRDGVSRRALDRLWEGSRSLDRDRDMDPDGHRAKDELRYRDRRRNLDRESSESRARSHSRPPPAGSKTTPLPVPLSKTPHSHSRRASYDQYAYDRPNFSSPKNDLDSYNHSRYASQSKPDLSRRHIHSSSTTHLPQNYPQHSRRRASLSTQYLPQPTSAPPHTPHFQYPAHRDPIRSYTMPPEDRDRWVAPQPQPPPPVIPQIAHYPPKGQGYYYASGNGYQKEHRIPPPPPPHQPPVVPAPLHEPPAGHGHGSRGRRVESPKHQPLLKRLLTNLTLTKQTGSPTRTRSPDSRGRRRRSF